MNNVKDALTRRFGPLPAWAWALVIGIGVYWYRNKSGMLSASSVTTGGSVTPNSPAPQPVTTLGPGESAYDPNTGQLLTSPSATDTTGGGMDIGGALSSLAQAIEDAITANAPTTAGGAPTTTGKPSRTEPKRKPKQKNPVRKIKGGSKKGRSPATHKTGTRGKSKATTHKPTLTRGRKPPTTAGKRTTGRIKSKLTRPVLRQRPATGHQGAHREVAPSVHRPAPARTAPRPTPARHSSTPARTPAPPPHRTVARKR